MERMKVEQALALLNTLTHEFGGNRDINALATLRAELGDMREELGATIDQRDLLSQEVLRLERELDGLRADAERWQWFKRHCVRTFSLDAGGQHGYCVTGVFGRIAGPNIDAAIDAARNKENDNG